MWYIDQACLCFLRAGMKGCATRKGQNTFFTVRHCELKGLLLGFVKARDKEQ